MWEFWWEFASHMPCRFVDALARVEGWLAVGAFLVLLVNRQLGKKVLSWEWQGLNPRWATLPVAVLFIYSNMYSIYEDSDIPSDPTTRKTQIVLPR